MTKSARSPAANSVMESVISVKYLRDWDDKDFEAIAEALMAQGWRYEPPVIRVCWCGTSVTAADVESANRRLLDHLEVHQGYDPDQARPSDLPQD